jgi:hypothetical protein
LSWKKSEEEGHFTEYHYGWYYYFRHLSFEEVNLGKIEETEDGKVEKESKQEENN